MQGWWRVVVLLLCVLVAGGLSADQPQPAHVGSGEDETEDVERNARILREWKKADPERYARLHRELQAFHALPPERQQQLRQLDADLHNLDPQTQRRLWEVLERYSLWYERLPEEDRKRVEGSADSEERLRVVRAIKEKQWLERLPQRTRMDLEAVLRTLAGPAERSAVIARYKVEEKQRRQKLRPGREKVGKPAKISALPLDVRTFVENDLRPQLNVGERKSLQDAEGKWPTLVLLIQELAERHSLHPPEPRELWDTAAKALPDVPDRVLRDFAYNELTGEERNNLNLSPTDLAESRDRLTRAFFAKKGDRELQRYRKQNKQMLSGK